jgi:hypothetical protein
MGIVPPSPPKQVLPAVLGRLSSAAEEQLDKQLSTAAAALLNIINQSINRVVLLSLS